MPERERLIELLQEGSAKAGDHLREATKIILAEKGHFNSRTDFDHRNIYEIEADHLLANGVIVPPFSLGQTVYIIDWGGKVASYKIYHISHTQNADKETYYCKAGEKGKNDIGFYDIQIGKTVFLAKEEAEAALKGGECDEGQIQNSNR